MNDTVSMLLIPPEPPANRDRAVGIETGTVYRRHPSGGWFAPGYTTVPPKTWRELLCREGRVVTTHNPSVAIVESNSGNERLYVELDSSGDVIPAKYQGGEWTNDPDFDKLDNVKQSSQLERWLATYYDN